MKKTVYLTLFTIFAPSAMFALVQFKNTANNNIELKFESKKIKGGIDTLDVAHHDTANLHDLSLQDLTSLKVRTFGVSIDYALDLNKLKRQAGECAKPVIVIIPGTIYGYDAQASCPRKIEEDWEIIGHSGK